MLRGVALEPEAQWSHPLPVGALVHAGSPLDQLASLSPLRPSLHCGPHGVEEQHMSAAGVGCGHYEHLMEERSMVHVPPLLNVAHGLSSYSSGQSAPSASPSRSAALAAALFHAATHASAPKLPTSLNIASELTAQMSDGNVSGPSMALVPTSRDSEGPTRIMSAPANSDVSTEWHVHLVRQAEALPQKRRDPLAGKSQLCVQCPNGRKHSSLFAVHLLPHWLPANQSRLGTEPQDIPVTASNIKVSLARG